jgi:hypothetical protein
MTIHTPHQLLMRENYMEQLQQAKMNENVKLTTDLFESENSTLAKYCRDEFGMELSTAIKEVKNIDGSLRNLKNIIDKLF